MYGVLLSSDVIMMSVEERVYGFLLSSDVIMMRVEGGAYGDLLSSVVNITAKILNSSRLNLPSCQMRVNCGLRAAGRTVVVD